MLQRCVHVWNVFCETKTWSWMKRAWVVFALTALCAIVGPFILLGIGMTTEIAFEEWNEIWPTVEEQSAELEALTLCKKDVTCVLTVHDYKRVVELVAELKRVNGSNPIAAVSHP